jgi:hypothetical protein
MLLLGLQKSGSIRLSRPDCVLACSCSLKLRLGSSDLPNMPYSGHSVRARDNGEIVLGWLTRIAVVGGLLGLACFEALSIGVTAVSLSDQSASAARQASDTWRDTHDIQRTYDSAVGSATEANAGNSVDASTFRVDQDGTVYLRVTREASTIVIKHIGAVASWAEVTREATGRPAL